MPWEKNFDVDETLEKAGQAFWSQGYEATSMHHLLATMGIQKGSFYSTYGSKHKAYLRSLEQYAETTFGTLQQATRGPSALLALRDLFEMIYEDCVSPDGHRGCMIINCALELAHEDPQAQAIVQKAIARHEAILCELVQTGQEAGEIDPALDAEATAKAMMAFTMGMRVYSRSGGDPTSIKTLADQAIRLVAPT